MCADLSQPCLCPCSAWVGAAVELVKGPKTLPRLLRSVPQSGSEQFRVRMAKTVSPLRLDLLVAFVCW